MAFPTGWSKRCAITIPAAQVGMGGVTDFTVLLTEANLPSGLFSDARSDGGDIRFSTDEAGSSQLAVDLIDFDAGGTALIRVGPVSLSAVSDNTIYLWYGAASETLPAASDTYGQYNAYDASHALYSPAGGDTDRVAGHTATTSGGVSVGGSTGLVGSATTYDGTDDYVSFGDHADFDGFSGDFTISTWIKFHESPDNSYLIAKYTPSGNQRSWGIIWNSGSPGDVRANLSSDGSSSANATYIFFSAANITLDDPYQIVIARSGTTIKSYLNATEKSSGTSTESIYDASSPLTLGARSDPTSYANVTLWQTAIHKGAGRSAAWITTEYNQTNDPASFASAGTPEDVGGGGGLTAGTLTEDSHTHNSATLSWTAASNNTGTVAEQLQRSPAGAGTWANVSGATSSPATDTGLDPETAYDYRVAYTDDEETVYSNTVEVTTDATPVPDLSVTVQGGDAVSDGGTDALGTVAQGSSQSRSYTITNDGTATATLGTITVGAGLTITADPSGQTIEPEGTKTLTVSVDTSVVAEIDAAISIPSDDPDSPYNWNLTASVTDQTAPTKTSMRIVGDQFTFRASESVTGDLTQLAFTASGGALTISSGGTFSGNSAVATLSREPALDETITATLSEPSGIKDAAENEMAGFTDEPVTVGGGGSSGGRASRIGIKLGIGI